MPITIDGTNGITQAGEFNSDSSFGFKNRLINGAMVIDQRNAGASVTIPASKVYTVDRFFANASQASKFTAQQNAGSVTPPSGFTNYLGATSSSAYSPLLAADYFFLQQNIEGFNSADLGWGSANAKTVTLSFWARSSLTGTFGGVLTNENFNRSYPFTYTISAANTWEQKSITIAGDTSGTWVTTNGIGIQVIWSLGAGSTYSGTAGAWAGAGYISATGATSVVGTNGATFYITGVQLEVGSTATSFDYRPYGTELQLCQRYLFAIKASEHSDVYCRFTQGDMESNTAFQSAFVLPVRMRATPTLTTTGTASNYANYAGGVLSACTSIPAIAAGNPQTLAVTSVCGGLTVGRGASLIANNNNTAYLYFGAEL
jgi:hypothetical protein